LEKTDRWEELFLKLLRVKSSALFTYFLRDRSTDRVKQVYPFRVDGHIYSKRDILYREKWA